MYRTQTKQGFTLIEILVVIAIIGILAGVIISSLSSARNNARDVALKQAADAFIKQAHLYYNQNNFSYANLVPSSVSTLPSRNWVGETEFGEKTCDNMANGGNFGNVSPYGDKFLEICKEIYKNLPKKENYQAFFGYRVGLSEGRSDWSSGRGVAVTVRLSNSNYYCVNTDGVTQESSVQGVALAGCRDNN